MKTRQVKKNQPEAENWLSNENINMALFILKIPTTLGSLYYLYNNMPNLRRDMELTELASRLSEDKGALTALLLLAMAGDDFSQRTSLTMAGINGYLLVLAFIPYLNLLASGGIAAKEAAKGVDISFIDAFKALISDAAKGFIAGSMGMAATTTGKLIKSGLNSSVSFFSGSKPEEKEDVLDHENRFSLS